MFTLKGQFTYQGTTPFIKGILSLLASLKASGARLSELNAFDGGSFFVQRGTVTFEVSGTEAEVNRFRTAYNA
jgi:hypothetical protein